ncbi:MAG: amidase [Acidimicrobiales bacterium]|nr:amidase [Acidimicrobiales bacterium]
MPKTMTEAAALLRAGELTSEALTEACFAVADRLDAELGTYIARYDETALAAAKLADEELAAGIDKGPLHGMPIGIKDIIACQEGQTTGQSLVFDPAFWAGEDAPVVARLRAAGAVITGKLTTMEYACGLPDPSKGYPTPRNPWDSSTWPGGSSSGSGSGVAAGMFLGALGTDTGGSIRMPAAFCGITGMKQTYGLVPKAGCLPLGVTLDHIGPMTRSTADAAAMLSVLAGYDGRDPSMPPGIAGADYLAALSGDLAGVTVGVVRSLVGGPLDDANLAGLFDDAVAVLSAAGATVVDVELPLWDEVGTACLVTAMTEAFAFHEPWMKTRWEDYGAPTRASIGGAVLYTAADYAQAQKVRRVAMAKVAELYQEVDLIVHPTACAGAPALDGIEWDSFWKILYTGYWNCTGTPSLSVPMGFTTTGLPLGLLINGKPLDDALVLRAGDAFQRSTTFHLELPPMLHAAAAL